MTAAPGRPRPDAARVGGAEVAPGPSAALDRHQARRDSGLPTVSVLAGPVDPATRAGRLWAEGRGRPVVEVSDPGLEPMVDAWAGRLAAAHDLAGEAVARVARRVGDRVDDLRARIARMGPPEFRLFLEAASTGQDGDGVEAACRWILGRLAGGESILGLGLAARLGAAIAGRTGGGPPERAFVALGGLIPPGAGPVILAAPGPGAIDAPGWVGTAARSLGRLALARPRSASILAVAPDALDAYLRSAPESREKALIRSGVVAAPGPAGGESGRRPAGATPAPDGPEGEDRARSEAERFLFDRLESLPATAGLFEPNATLDIPFGAGRAMEVDLASRALMLAIEVDGYHHFRGEADYRRDRRKDFLLQARGYLVVRVLAEDVVRHLEAVLDTILAAVASRRRDPEAPNRDAAP